MALQLCSSSFHSLNFNALRRRLSPTSHQTHYAIGPTPQDFLKKEPLLSCRSTSGDEEYLYMDDSAGDVFSFNGGKYSDEPGPADEWFKKGTIDYVKSMRTILKDQNWKIKTTICWGERDRWLSYDGVEHFCKEAKHKLINIPAAGYHVQEDSGEALAQLIAQVVGSKSFN